MLKKALSAITIVIALFSTHVSAQPPSEYDLRDLNLVTSVKAQKQSTCWAHATASSIEGNLLVTGNWKNAGETGEPNIAEYHYDWWFGFNKAWNGDFEGTNATGLGIHSWGDFKMFCSYMSRLEGPIREIDAPGDDAGNIPSQSATPLYKESYHRWYITDLNWYYIDGDGPFGSCKNIDTIKNVVMRNGVTATNYNCIGTGGSSWQGLPTHYQPQSNNAGTNHNVGIIGWDDACVTEASENGAWLLKNSWGTSNTPYFWISYYDKHCCRQIEESCVSFHNVQPVLYTGVYYHDYHGWRGTFNNAKECFNKFTAEETSGEWLIDVSFFTMVDHEEWEIKVYDKFENDELQEELASVSGYNDHIGYHTAKLSNFVTLKSNDDFYIYLKVKNGGLAHDRTSSPFNPDGKDVRVDAVVPSKSEEDQSYYRTSPTSAWTDLYNHEETITANGQSIDCQGTQNFCLKGYTIDTMPTGIEDIPVSPNTPFQLYNYPNPFASHTTIQYSVLENSVVSVGVFNARGRQVYSFADTRHTAGTYKTVWYGRDTFNKPLSSGVYYAMLTVKTGDSVRTERKRIFLMR